MFIKSLLFSKSISGSSIIGLSLFSKSNIKGVLS